MRSAMKRISLGKDPAFDRWLKEGRDREKRMIVAKGDASPDLSTLSARVAEAAVGYVAVESADPRSWPGGPDAWMADQETACDCGVCAAVDAYRKAKEGR